MPLLSANQWSLLLHLAWVQFGWMLWFSVLRNTIQRVVTWESLLSAAPGGLSVVVVRTAAGLLRKAGTGLPLFLFSITPVLSLWGASPEPKAAYLLKWRGNCFILEKHREKIELIFSGDTSWNWTQAARAGTQCFNSLQTFLPTPLCQNSVWDGFKGNQLGQC